MTPYLDDGDVRLYAGDCVEVMAAMPEASVQAVCTDPPYGLRFMGKAWDGLAIAEAARDDAERRRSLGPHSDSRPGRSEPRSSSAFGPPAGQAGSYDFSLTGNRAFGVWCETWARETLRVLVPGGHLLAFGGTRTFHRLTCALEDAGFEIRDCLSWLYGQGFPKSLDVSKAIDREAGAEREVVGTKLGRPGMAKDGRNQGYDTSVNTYGSGEVLSTDITAPATPEAPEWQGWGTALKPGWEPIVLARKPLAERTVARQVLATGTGGLNVDGCRIETTDDLNGGAYSGERRGATSAVAFAGRGIGEFEQPAGRWPANVVLDEEAAAVLDEQAGERTSGSGPLMRRGDKFRNAYGAFSGGDEPADVLYGDTGGASRFFYTAKASSAERDGSKHPTVKPLALMRWLVRLVTPPGGTILDPFAGSGTTLLAAREEGFRAIGIEREDEYLEDAAYRLRQLSLLAGAP